MASGARAGKTSQTRSSGQNPSKNETLWTATIVRQIEIGHDDVTTENEETSPATTAEGTTSTAAEEEETAAAAPTKGGTEGKA